jgi:hypothetical protein
MTIIEQRIYNLRHELAKQAWNARHGNMDVLSASENTRDLVALFPDDMIEVADRLQHKIMNQLTKIYGRKKLISKGINCCDIAVSRIATRAYLHSVRLSSGMIG